MKIKNEKITAYMGRDFVADTMSGKYTYKKGTAFESRVIHADYGVNIVEGHGISHVIPRDCFTKFIRTWNEVEVVGGTTTITKRREDVTDEYLKWFTDYDKKVKKTATDRERVNLKHRITELRAKIKFVKSGAAMNELSDNLLKMAQLIYK